MMGLPKIGRREYKIGSGFRSLKSGILQPKSVELASVWYYVRDFEWFQTSLCDLSNNGMCSNGCHRWSSHVGGSLECSGIYINAQTKLPIKVVQRCYILDWSVCMHGTV